MKIAYIDVSFLILSGITLSSSFTMTNPHETLAVMFEITSKPNFLDIEPQRGMILCKDRKVVKVRIKPALRNHSKQYESTDNAVIVNSTYFSEYNRKILHKLNIDSWKQISTSYQTISLCVTISCEVDHLKETILKSESAESRSDSKKLSSFDQFRKTAVRKVKNVELKKDLDFIFHSNAANVNTNQSHKVSSTVGDFKKKSQDKMYHDKTQLPKLANPRPAELLPSINKIASQVPKARTSSERTVQIIILAVIAALLLSIGQTFGYHFK